MRKFVLCALCLVWFGAAASTRGQGTVNFDTSVGPGSSFVNAPVFVTPGLLATGPRYVGLLLGGADPIGLAPLGSPAPFGTGVMAGYLAGGERTIPVIPAGGPAFVQLVAWDAMLYSDYAAAASFGSMGKSAILFLSRTGDPTASPPDIPVELVGLQGFTMVVPEPAPLLLALLGAGLVWGAKRLR